MEPRLVSSRPRSVPVRVHPRGMARTEARRRCPECRARFHPNLHAVAMQVVCSAECRLLRRRKQAKGRRALDLEGYRQAERARKQLSRQGDPPAVPPPPAPATPPEERPSSRAGSRPLSRTGFAREVAELPKEFSLLWARIGEASRTRIVRETRRILEGKSPSVGQGGP
jgi:hypothetical protein